MVQRLPSLVRLPWWRRVLNALSGRSSTLPAYEAGGTSRLRSGWTTRNQGPNSFGSSVATMRARARDGVRNDAHMARIVTVLAQNIVGYEIEPRPLSEYDEAIGGQLLKRDSEKAAKLAAALYRDWSKKVDLEGVLNAGGAQNLAARAEVTDGEVFVVRRLDPSFGRVPLRLDILEADMLDDSRTESLASGGRIIQGVEFDRLGRRVAYHFRRSHPGESLSLFTSYDTDRIPEADVIHLYMPTRPKQVRGITRLAPILASKVDLASYESFELQRKRTEAMVVGVVTPGDDAATPQPDGSPLVGSFGVENADGEVVEQMQPGMFVNARGGKEIKFSQPSAIGGYAEYKRAILQQIAVGVQLTYELLTGDLSQVNYSSLRAGMLQFWSHLDQLQWMLFIPRYCQRVWEWFTEAAYMAGELPTPWIPVSWSVPKRPQVDPAKDILADILRIRAGLVPHEEVSPEYGYTLDEIIKSAERLNELLKKANITFDTDPQKYAFRGAFPHTGVVVPPPTEDYADEEESSS